MEKRYRVMGTAGNLVLDEPVESKWLHIFAHMRFVDYVKDETGTVCGGKFLIDEGHGYGFDYGERFVTLRPGEELQFEHNYTDTSEGTWDDGSLTVKVRLLESE